MQKSKFNMRNRVMTVALAGFVLASVNSFPIKAQPPAAALNKAANSDGVTVISIEDLPDNYESQKINNIRDIINNRENSRDNNNKDNNKDNNNKDKNNKDNNKDNNNKENNNNNKENNTKENNTKETNTKEANTKEANTKESNIAPKETGPGGSTVPKVETSATDETQSSQLSLGEQVVLYASQFIGNPYVYGGTSLTNGADCSGFVMKVYQKFGISLPRTSRDQGRAGVDVGGLENARPGDVVSYRGHIGIYIGQNQLVHASSPEEGIKISPVNYKPILSIRRFV